MAQQSTALPAVYSDTVVRLFAVAAVLWGIVGMLVGVIAILPPAPPRLSTFTG